MTHSQMSNQRQINQNDTQPKSLVQQETSIYTECESCLAAVRWLWHNRFELQWKFDGQWFLVRQETSIYRECVHGRAAIYWLRFSRFWLQWQLSRIMQFFDTTDSDFNGDSMHNALLVHMKTRFAQKAAIHTKLVMARSKNTDPTVCSRWKSTMPCISVSLDPTARFGLNKRAAPLLNGIYARWLQNWRFSLLNLLWTFEVCFKKWE